MADQTSISETSGDRSSKIGGSSETAVYPYRRRDPYYIHPSDNSGAQITKNKLGFIDGTIVPPEDTLSEEFMKWSDADSLVLSWLLHSMTKDLMEAYMFTPTSRDLWLELEEKFGTSDRSQIYDLRKQLIQIVQGLDESYNSTVSTILLMDPLPSYNKVYSLVNRIEGQKSGGSSSNTAVEASALVAKVTEQYKTVTNSSGKKKEFGKKGDRVCAHCNRPGHLEDACFKKHGYPEWYKEYKLRKSSQNPTLAVTGGSTISESK
ncbi:Retrovirus-related Pol polyprotein from transposon RE1 [Senna tora]|uniref:Retrovirus-related Pol polyprotein from transposon RE1 n=1 Tax=Senna tora TaxID=362788 RepID=A0A835CJ33_9FABA|nr:Retrovirus-related Pol polyprotein from transposon RE1 [Senna tora]